MTLASGHRLGHYRLVRPLGKGGMGEVYLAEDTKLKRRVALKVLPEAMASDPDRLERFQREARAVAAVNHPHIVTIHSVEEADGFHFLTMELVEGQTLAELVPASGFGLEQLLQIALPLVDALRAAHQRGVIHRDLKAANVMVSDEGRVKILDFGLAQLKEAPEAAALSSLPTLEKMTREGQVVGTLGYMSPEQALGKGLDARTDLFSLGVLLYEMATGRRPFRGDTAAALFDELLNKSPVPPDRLKPGLSAELGRLIGRALEKDPDARYRSTEDLLADLERLSSAGPSRAAARADGPRSIVVVPFEDISPGKDNEYFSDGLTEELISDLSKVRALRVISRSSAMRLKGSRLGVRAIARDLAVQYVLEGSVRKAGDQLRITAQLIDAEQDASLWSDTYRGTLEDVFEIQERVARAIVNALRVTLTPGEAHGFARRSISDVHAYESYLRARQEIWRFSKEGLDRALQLLRNALDTVGANALLYATLGHSYTMFIQLGLSADPSHLENAAECARKAFDLEPGSAQGHWLRGLLHYMAGRYQEAVRDLRHVLLVEPGHADALMTLGYVYGLAGRESAARPLFDTLLQIDPLTPLNQAMPGFLAAFEGRFEGALPPYRRFYEMDPASPFARWTFAWALSMNGRQQDACKIFEGIVEDMPNSVFASLSLLWKHALRGERDRALQAVTPELLAAAASTEMFARLVAEGYGLASEKEAAIDCLETAVRFGLTNYPYLSRVDPFLESLRGEERFRRLMTTVKERWERFEA